jgi:hypothetical protein
MCAQQTGQLNVRLKTSKTFLTPRKSAKLAVASMIRAFQRPEMKMEVPYHGLYSSNRNTARHPDWLSALAIPKRAHLSWRNE